MSEPQRSGVNPVIWVTIVLLALLGGAFLLVGVRTTPVVMPPVTLPPAVPVQPPESELPPDYLRVPPVPRPITPPKDQPSLGQKYKTALGHMDRGEYAKGYALLVEIKETVEEEDLRLNPATRQELDRKLKEAVDKMREASETPAPAPAVDPARLGKITAMAQKYADAQALMKQKDYAGALKLFLEVQTLSKELGSVFADSDRKALEANIAACREAIAENR